MLTVNLDKVLEDICDHEGTRTDYQVFMSIAKYMDGNGVSKTPQKLIAEETGCARRTVSVSINRLAEKGFLTVEKTATDTKGVSRGVPSNIYRINPWYLIHTKSAKRTSKPQCAACCECKQSERKHSRREHKPEITIDDVLAYSGANSQRIEVLCKRVTKLEDHQCDVDDRLARIGEVAADVIKNIFKLYEEKNK